MNQKDTTAKHSNPQTSTFLRGENELTTTAQEPDYTREHVKHSTSTPQHACSIGITQQTSQRRALYKRGVNKATPHYTWRSRTPQTPQKMMLARVYPSRRRPDTSEVVNTEA